MALAAYGGLEAMNSAETKPKELRLGKPCAGKPLARFDEGGAAFAGYRFDALSTLQPHIIPKVVHVDICHRNVTNSTRKRHEIVTHVLFNKTISPERPEDI